MGRQEAGHSCRGHGAAGGPCAQLSPPPPPQGPRSVLRVLCPTQPKVGTASAERHCMQAAGAPANWFLGLSWMKLAVLDGVLFFTYKCAVLYGPHDRSWLHVSDTSWKTPDQGQFSPSCIASGPQVLKGPGPLRGARGASRPPAVPCIPCPLLTISRHCVVLTCVLHPAPSTMPGTEAVVWTPARWSDPVMEALCQGLAHTPGCPQVSFLKEADGVG